MSAEINLSPDLVLDSFVAIRYANEPSSQVTHKVLAAWPQVIESDPPQIDTGMAETITLKGYNFQANMTLHAKYPGGQKQALPFTYTDSETITISVPALATRGRIMLSPVAANQVPGTDGAHGYTIEVCESN